MANSYVTRCDCCGAIVDEVHHKKENEDNSENEGQQQVEVRLKTKSDNPLWTIHGNTDPQPGICSFYFHDLCDNCAQTIASNLVYVIGKLREASQ